MFIAFRALLVENEWCLRLDEEYMSVTISHRVLR